MNARLLFLKANYFELRTFCVLRKVIPILRKCFKGSSRNIQICRKVILPPDFDTKLCASLTLEHSSVFCGFHRTYHLSKGFNMAFQQSKDKYLAMRVEEKRKIYKCGKNYVTVNEVQPWIAHCAQLQTPCTITEEKYEGNSLLNSKVSIFVGDITALEVDVVVNAANNALLGGGGVDGAIHKAAGPLLLEECRTLNGCKTGEAKITGGYELPAKYVIHTVGPVGEKPDVLKQCYYLSLELMKEHGLETIAFPCISTGVYGYPNEPAAHVALKTVREWLDENFSNVRKVVFCLFLHNDLEIYENLMQHYFPSA